MHIPAETALAALRFLLTNRLGVIMLADHVIAPRLIMEPDTAATLGNVYSPYRDANYGERVETPYWTRRSHRKKSGSEVASVTTQPVAIR